MLSRSFTIEEIDNSPIDFENPNFNSEEYKVLKENIKRNQDSLPDVKIQDDLVFKRTCCSKLFPWRILKNLISSKRLFLLAFDVKGHQKLCLKLSNL